MDEKLLAYLIDRIFRARELIELAHDPELIGALQEIIEEAEADIRALGAAARPAIPLRPG